MVSDIPAGDGKLVNLFLRCTVNIRKSGRAVGVEWNCKIELNCVLEEMWDSRWVKLDHKKGNDIEDPRV